MMKDSFISRRDRIVASAIEIISDAGLESLSTKSLANRENMSESLLYKYFGGLNEVLIAVVSEFVKFDDAIITTVSSKEITNLEKIRLFLYTYVSYYDTYKAMSSIILNYEALLHNVYTRDMISESIMKRNQFLLKLCEGAIDDGEIDDVYTAEELRSLLMSTVDGVLINRRVIYRDSSLKTEVMAIIDKTISLIAK